MTKIVIHAVIVLLMDGVVKIDHSPFCWGYPGTPPRTVGSSPDTTLRTTALEFSILVLITCSFPSIRFEMQDTGVTQEATLKNFSLVPYFLNSCQTEAALSVPA